MFQLTITATALLALQVAARNPELQSMGLMELHNSTINCDLHSCRYSFSLHGIHSGVETAMTPCNFSVTATPPHIHFENVGCEPSDIYRVNGAWGANTSIVMCFTNIQQGVYAWFGFDEWEIRGGKSVTFKDSPVYMIGEFSK
ncbi:hypothetical protein F4780DRAFT_602367 [Xylariomycetidae sp. FL0641]|nr:hypothetical protein F4780DRAFT_602367 [Xylariomycetidae sp. FL0641]